MVAYIKSHVMHGTIDSSDGSLLGSFCVPAGSLRSRSGLD